MQLRLLSLSALSALLIASACGKADAPPEAGAAGQDKGGTAASAAGAGGNQAGAAGDDNGGASPAAGAGPIAGADYGPEPGLGGSGGEAGAPAGSNEAAGQGGGNEGGSPTLTAGEVQFSVHCCTSPPSAANLSSTIVTAAIGPGIEFPAIGAQGSTVINADVDVSDGSLSILYGAPAQAASGAFNGYVLDFVATPEHPVLPRITAAELSPETTFSSGVSVTFDDDSLFINVSGLAIAAQSKIVVRFSLE